MKVGDKVYYICEGSRDIRLETSIIEKVAPKIINYRERLYKEDHKISLSFDEAKKKFIEKIKKNITTLNSKLMRENTILKAAIGLTEDMFNEGEEK